MIFFIIVITLTLLQRIIELFIARRNTQLLLSKGAKEFGATHYWMLVCLHSFFFLSMAIEYAVRRPSVSNFWPVALTAFLVAQVARIWIIHSMNGRWTTRILVLPKTPLVTEGPFRLLRHPNYLVVAIEIAVLPLVFGLYYTSAIFTVLNGLVLLGVRIPEENRALKTYCAEL